MAKWAKQHFYLKSGRFIGRSVSKMVGRLSGWPLWMATSLIWIDRAAVDTPKTLSLSLLTEIFVLISGVLPMNCILVGNFCCVEFTRFIPLFTLLISVMRIEEEELHASKTQTNTRWADIFRHAYVPRYLLRVTLIYIIFIYTASLSCPIFSTNILKILIFYQ